MTEKNQNGEVSTEENQSGELSTEENLNESKLEAPLQSEDHAQAHAENTEIKKIKSDYEAAKYKFKTYLIMAIVVLFTINILSGTFIFLLMRYQIKMAAVSISEDLDEIVVGDIKKQITDDFLKAYLRERYLPEDYVSIGLYVNSKAQKSVVEVQCGTTALTAKSTGLIINDEGYVLTNAHNITDTTEILGGSIDNPTTIIEYTVYPMVMTKTYGSSELHEMIVISYDVGLDLAILKFNNMPDGLDYAVFSHHDAVTPGEEVVLIGNALGLGITVSEGTVLGTYNYNSKKMIQLDALAVKGNSGAPVFNIYAEVIGLMSFKITEDAEVSGVGYSVSVYELIEYIKKVNFEQDRHITYTVVNLNG